MLPGGSAGDLAVARLGLDAEKCTPRARSVRDPSAARAPSAWSLATAPCATEGYARATERLGERRAVRRVRLSPGRPRSGRGRDVSSCRVWEGCRPVICSSAAASGCARVDLVSGKSAPCAAMVPRGAALAAGRRRWSTSGLPAGAGSPSSDSTHAVVGDGSGRRVPPPRPCRAAGSSATWRGVLEQAASGAAAPRIRNCSIRRICTGTSRPRTHRRLILDLGELHSRSNDLVAALPASLPLAGITVTPECDTCGLCVNHCPHGALTIEGRSVTCDASRCTGCGVCVEACPRTALRIGPAQLTTRPRSATVAATPSATR